MTRLERIVFAHNQYWSGKLSPLTDPQYDQEILWLKKEYPDHWILKSLGNEAKNKVHHKAPMLSLEKAYTFEEVKKFINDSSRDGDECFVCQAKFDGLAAKLHDGILATRGNGEYGEDITRKIPDIVLVQGTVLRPLNEVKTVDFCLGEIVCLSSVFEKFGQEFKHPRNFVAGMVGRKGALPKGVKLHLVEYKTSPGFKFTKKEFDEKLWQKILLYFENYSIYPKDGIVIKVADKKHYKELGRTSHHPLGAIAYKYKGETATASLISVEWQSGKDKLTPVANISPTELNGVIITKVTLHNYKTVKDFKMQVGDELTIERSGDVIPHLLDVKKTELSKEYIDIKSCPVCNAGLTHIGPNVFCSNEECSGKFSSKLMNSIREFEIEFVGGITLERILSIGKINSFADFLDIKVPDLTGCGLGLTMSVKIRSSIESKRKNVPAERFLAALNIGGVGRDTWKDILKKIDFDRLTSEKIPVQELTAIEGIGELTARKIRQGLCIAKEEIERMKELTTVKKIVTARSSKTICFTGKMPKSRTYYETLAREYGFEPVDGVTKDLSLLVCDDPNSTSSKMKSAQKYGVKILSLQDFIIGVENETNSN